ncbi:hypothetical protein V6N13_079165 [Hibiscus sabdariffa]
MVVPKNKIYHLKPIDFSGPCNSPLILKVRFGNGMHACLTTPMHTHTLQLPLLLPSFSSLAVKHQPIGSLGAGNSSAYVSNVIVNRATSLLPTKQTSGGSGYAKNIKFQNIKVHNVSNPIIIAQYYCDHHKAQCPQTGNHKALNPAITSSQEDKEQHIAEASCSDIRLSYRWNVSPPC